MRAVVCAYGEVGHECLEELIDLGVGIPLVVTHRDDPKERLWFRSVADLARSNGIEVSIPEDVNSAECLERISAARPDFLFSFYFRQMLKSSVLETPTRGALNLHGSLLPRYRGRAPVNWVLLNGESETGVTLHYMDERPDHGDIVCQQAVPIQDDDTPQTLTRKLAAAGRVLLRDVVPRLDAGTAPRTPQDHSRSSYFGGRKPADGEIDWQMSAEQIRNLVRAVTEPWPGAFSSLRGERLMIWWCERTEDSRRRRAPGEIWIEADGLPRVATGEGSLLLCQVGRAGGPSLSAARWARKESIRSGEQFAAFAASSPARELPHVKAAGGSE